MLAGVRAARARSVPRAGARSIVRTRVGAYVAAWQRPATVLPQQRVLVGGLQLDRLRGGTAPLGFQGQASGLRV